ncbi:mRNA export factor GLE1 isoform X2 [Diospyros lotus]|uniref:mRNA export factor GLE1 isoform X2 n=1 Tax=Diospyros lotus TaxID=55363 RepID=UPI002251FD18|nr:mRNA export factor GLE1 isoform X2 [Diospyros lotus]
MGAVKLEPRCPQRIGGIVIDPQPDWSFDGLLSELSLIEKKLHISSTSPFSIRKSGEVFSAKSAERRGFVMRVDEMVDSEEDSKGEACDWPLVRARRFTCDEFDISYDSEDDSMSETLCLLMDKVGLIEGALSELTHDHQLRVKDEIRNQILAWEADLMIENNKFTSALAQVKKYVEARQEMDRKLDVQYQRKKAEALDNHLTAVQRDHEHKSQIEERRIRDDAAIEEAKRREKALQEEKFRQEKLRAEAEARLEAEKKRAEEAKAAALETERKAAKEAEKKIAAEDSARSAAAAAVVPSTDATGSPKRASLGILNDQSNKSVSDGVKTVQQAGNALKCAESALKLEDRRRQIYQEVAAKNASLGLGSSSAHLSLQSKINRLIKQISGSKENVRKKVDQLNQIFFDSSCPQSISVAIYAEKIVDQCVNPNNSVFAYAYVTVLLASQVPLVMDLVLAKLNKVCIYTVPKYISYSKSSFDTKAAHYKAIGYKEEDGQIENEESYVSGIASYMSLYGALVQTEIQGIQHAHGLGEGWSWLARFLNALPANLYTAVALQAFLEVAGFGLYRRYKSQFKKLLSVVYHDFTSAFKEPAGVNPKLSRAITGIRTYMETKGFLKEPEGRSLQNSLLSHDFVPDLESSDHYHYQQSRPFYHY